MSIYPFKIIFLLFILFSFAGWCCEVVYVGILSEHKFINRGFLYGPICPIYGCGGVVLLLLPKILSDTWIPLFFASMILCSVVEYFASWLLEKMFHTLWWDYSHYKFNLRGRICLLNSVLFGIMGVIGVHFVLPFALSIIESINDLILTILAHSLGIVLSVDLLFTLKRLIDFNIQMEKIREFKENLKEYYKNEDWFHGETLEEMIEAIKEKASSEKDKFSQAFLEKVESIQHHKKNVHGFINRFPTCKLRNNSDILVFIKKAGKQQIAKIKNKNR